MSPAAPIEPTKKTLPESSSSAESSPGRADLENNRGFRYLRGVQWRIDLGILPSSSSSSVDDLRRVTANSRRSYASLRRRLLIDPHIPKDGSNFPDLVMDNPLSQNPDSMWGRFFHKAELEKMVDQDLSRLYPEHGSYFQTPGCQGVLRRILLLWCIRHPNYGYRQGMHELLAPLVYVLQADVERLSEVRKLYPDYFTDNFDGLSLHGTDSDSISNLDKVSPDDIGIQKDQVNIINILNELDPKIQTIISFSDAYGAEGELGIVLSEKFMEHDAYCMFDALMDGSGGAVAMANFFSHSPLGGLQNGIPPVLEASSALYHLLSIVDSSLYSHLVQLGVEPQYFALRWLRVLFGREFTLDDLLVIWDEIFALDNKNFSGVSENESEVSFAVLKSCRGAFISALAVSMILYLRSSILATENAASCLQRLLNFPEDVNLRKLMKKAKSLVGLATGAISSIREPVQAGGAYEPIKPVRGQSLPSDPAARGSPCSSVPDSYWEEKWRVMHREEQRQVSPHKQIQNRLKSWSQRVKMRLSRTQSTQSCSNVNHEKVDPTRSSARRNLLDDLGRQLGSENQKLASEDECKERFSSVNGASEENTSIFSEPISPRGFQANTNNDHENDTERRSVTSNSSVHKTFPQRITAPSPAIGLYNSTEEVASPLPLSDAPENTSFSEVHNEDTPTKSLNETQNEDTTRRSSNETQNEDTTRKSLNKTQNEDTTRKSLSEAQNEDATRKYLNEIHHNEDNRGKPETNLKEKRLLSGKFQWLWMFAKTGAEGSSEKGECTSEATGSSVVESDQKTTVASSSTIESTTQPETLDRNNNVSALKNLAQSMLENIQVIESVFQQDKAQMETVENMSKNDLVGRGQITAMAALKELRKISNILSEM